VLVHDMPKVGKHGCRLPIHDREATIITAQQARVRATFPDTPTDRLALFPRPLTNPDGTKALRRFRDFARTGGPFGAVLVTESGSSYGS
jgi:hypothetical protein